MRSSHLDGPQFPLGTYRRHLSSTGNPPAIFLRLSCGGKPVILLRSRVRRALLHLIPQPPGSHVSRSSRLPLACTDAAFDSETAPAALRMGQRKAHREVCYQITSCALFCSLAWVCFCNARYWECAHSLQLVPIAKLGFRCPLPPLPCAGTTHATTRTGSLPRRRQ